MDLSQRLGVLQQQDAELRAAELQPPEDTPHGMQAVEADDSRPPGLSNALAAEVGGIIDIQSTMSLVHSFRVRPLQHVYPMQLITARQHAATTETDLEGISSSKNCLETVICSIER